MRKSRREVRRAVGQWCVPSREYEDGYITHQTEDTDSLGVLRWEHPSLGYPISYGYTYHNLESRRAG